MNEEKSYIIQLVEFSLEFFKLENTTDNYNTIHRLYLDGKLDTVHNIFKGE